MEAPSELAARPVHARPDARSAEYVLAVRMVFRIGILAIAGVAAYHYSLTLLVRDLAAQTTIGYLALVPVIAIALAVRRARRTTREPAIHDRYSDYIIGLPLLFGALWMTIVLPIQLSLFYWTWRLDMLSLPLFVAGAVCLVFGLRALWRYRVAIVYLLLVWPVPHIWLIHQLPADLNVRLVMALGGVGLVVIAFVIGGGLRRNAQGVEPREHPAPAVLHARSALTLVLLAGLGIALADSSMSRFELTLRDTGDSRIPQFDATAAQLAGWSPSMGGSPTRLSLGGASSWDRYTAHSSELPATGLGGSAVSLDVISTNDPHALSRYPLDVLYRFHGYRALDQQVVDLGAGIIGHAMVYADPTGRTRWTAVYWDWPVVSANGPGFQRMVINQRTAAASDPPGAPRPQVPATSPRLALVNWLDGTKSLDAALLQQRAVLVDAARAIVRAEVDSLPAGDRP